MLNEEIVFLDSDEDREVKQKMEVEQDLTKNSDTDNPEVKLNVKICI